MLVRSSRKKLQHHAARGVQAAYEQLRLPWLCPAIYNNGISQCRRSATSKPAEKAPLTTLAPTRPAPISSPRPKSPGRGFASPAVSNGLEAQEEYIPFESPSIGRGWDRHSALSELTPWDEKTILTLPSEAQLSPTAYARKQGTSNEAEEMHAILEAHLHVGHFERAASTLRRLETICDTSSPRLHNAYLAYLATLVSHLVVTKNDALWGTLRRWFNEDYRAKGLKATPTMITLLVQAGLRGPKQNKINRVIRHFLHLAEKDGVLSASLIEMEASLSEEEFERIKEAAPTNFESSELTVNGAEFVPPGDRRTKIMPQAQKGKGLETLYTALESLYNAQKNSAQDTDAFLKGLGPRAARQWRIEQDVSKAALDKWEADSKSMMQRANASNVMSQRQIGALAWKWHETLAPLIQKSLDQEITGQESTKHGDVDKALYPYLRHIAPSKLSAVTIMSVVESTVRSSQHVPVTRVVAQLGRDIQDECTAQLIKARNQAWMKRHRSQKDRTRKLQRLVRHDRTAPAERLYDEVLPTGENEWTNPTMIKVGGFFLHLLTQSAYVDMSPKDSEKTDQEVESQPAFTIEKALKNGYWTSVLSVNPEFHSLLRSVPPETSISKHLPMLMEPVPWSGWKRGGYIRQGVSVVRTTSMHADTRDHIKLAIEKGDMDQIFAALDILGRTPWKINKPVLEVMTQAWNTGEAFANFPPSDPKFNYPSEPTDMTDKAARRQYVYDCKKIDDEKDGMHSNRCFANFQLEVARAYADETFYFPHNVDFRGRAYPIPPYLNHMGADHCRGLLQFGKGRALGQGGLRWLKIQLANVYGYDKASLSERESFANEHMEQIRESTTSPLNGQKWWLNADDPWQCLAACFELVNALDSPDPAKFVSYLPIHQDGTCNGLQHYAALGGDRIGAAQVNLEPGDRPADIYTAIASMVQEAISSDAGDGDQVAKLLDGLIKRKVVKQTVMTNVYGVTLPGATQQIRRQLDDFYPGRFEQLPYGAFSASNYLAKKVFQAMKTMFDGAHEIQYWLADCAGRICKSLSLQQIRHIEDHIEELAQEEKPMKRMTQLIKLGAEETRLRSPVVWTTPLRMPVVQPYRTKTTRAVSANFLNLAVNASTPKDPIHKRRQIAAFPPNFIHSLDATHMFLAALKSNEAGLSFAAVHDSFWTHAADVDQMNNTLRDAFIRMHSEDIIGRLAAEMSVRYKDCMYLVSVPRHSKVGRQIAALPAFKRQAGLSRIPLRKQFLRDLLQERQRLRLLQSNDPTEREEGKAMMTPGRLLSEMPAEDFEYNIDEDNLDRVFRDAPQGVRDAVIARFKAGSKVYQNATHGRSSTEVISEDPASTQNATEKTREDVGSVDAIELIHEKSERDADKGNCGKTGSDNQLEDAARQTMEETLFRRLRMRKSVKIHVWAPLVIPPVPKKGDFDVRRINDSKYFFS